MLKRETKTGKCQIYEFWPKIHQNLIKIGKFTGVGTFKGGGRIDGFYKFLSICRAQLIFTTFPRPRRVKLPSETYSRASWQLDRGED